MVAMEAQRRRRTGPVQRHYPRDRPHVVSDDRGLRRAALRLDGRRVQHLHQHVFGGRATGSGTTRDDAAEREPVRDRAGPVPHGPTDHDPGQPLQDQRQPAAAWRMSSPRSCCCAAQQGAGRRRSSTPPSASTPGGGRSSTRSRRISSAPWKKCPAATSPGSGAASSTPPRRSTRASNRSSRRRTGTRSSACGNLGAAVMPVELELTTPTAATRLVKLPSRSGTAATAMSTE